MFLAYSFLLSLGMLVALPYYWWRYRTRHLPAGYWRERFGHLPDSFDVPPGDRCLAWWFHAVSVGETLAIADMVQALRKRHPERPIFLSHVTPTGRAVGEKRIQEVTGRFYLPFDWAWTVRRVTRRIRPAVLVITETELWPNLLRIAHGSKVHVVMVNARLSDRSFRGYRRFRPFFRRVLGQIDWIFAQTPRDADRFRQLGAAPERVITAGNMKFDFKPPRLGELPGRLAEAFAKADRGPIVVAASTMPGEEPRVLSAWDDVRHQHDRAVLILAPRHPARFKQVGDLLASDGRRFLRRTELDAAQAGLERQAAEAEVLLLDTLGELAGIFSVADVVFMGGSLVRTGGHNLIEPAYWSKPVVFGPNMQNFRDAAELFLDAQAAVRVRDAKQLGQALLRLLEDSKLRSSMGEAAKRLLDSQSGATERILEHLTKYLNTE